MSNVETGVYSAASLERALLALERHYGLDSESFLQAHRSDAPEVRHIPGFQRHTWASYYSEWRELTSREELQEDRLATQIERELDCVA